MQSPSKHSTDGSPSSSPSPSPKRPPSPTHYPEAQAPSTNTYNATQNSAPPAAPTGGDKGTKLSKRTLRNPKQGAKQANGSPSPADAGLVEVPIREMIALGSREGGSAAATATAVVVDSAAVRTSRVKDVHGSRGGPKKIKLHLKRKPAEASTSLETPICLFCPRQFPTRTTLLHHLQMEHPTTQGQVHDQTSDHHQGEDNGGGDSGAEKKSEEEGSSAATEGNNGLDLNQPIEEVLVSAENQEEGTSGKETIDGPRKKFRFDLNEFPPQEDEDENKP